VAVSNRKRTLRPVRVEPYPGPALVADIGAPPDGQFGQPPPGQIDVWSPDGSSPPTVLLAHAVRTRCNHCGARPGLVWLGDDRIWRTVTRHNAECPDSVEQRGLLEELIAVPDREFGSAS
jgi:hypothetical protein